MNIPEHFRVLTSKQLAALIVVVVLVSGFIRVIFIEGFIVRGDSMAPTIHPGDYVFVYKRAYRGSREPRRGDVVVVTPRAISDKVVKRVIGLPGERLEIADGKVYIKPHRTSTTTTPLEEPYLAQEGTPLTGLSIIKLDTREYFVLGDNRYWSSDSRELGPVDHWDLSGRVFLSIRIRNLTIRTH